MLSNKVLQDPLLESKNLLPKFAHTLNLTHWSPTSLGMADGPFIFKYLELSKEEKNRLPANSQMKAGIASGAAVQTVLADIYFFLIQYWIIYFSIINFMTYLRYDNIRSTSTM